MRAEASARVRSVSSAESFPHAVAKPKAEAMLEAAKDRRVSGEVRGGPLSIDY
jgi:hypothetical protein